METKKTILWLEDNEFESSGLETMLTTCAKDFEILAYVSSSADLVGQERNGKPVISPLEIRNYDFQYLYVAVFNYHHILKQIINDFKDMPIQVIGPESIFDYWKNTLGEPVYFNGFKLRDGYCPVCQTETLFRDGLIQTTKLEYFFCIHCNSQQRERSLILALNDFYPNWRNSVIYEPGPCNTASACIAGSCPRYTFSHYFKDVEPGSYHDSVRCENLESLTYPDESFDLVITQDVLEHVFNPDLAFKEIARVLKPGGAHVFTVPWRGYVKSKRRARMEKDGTIIYLEKPEYHGDPLSQDDILATFDWGIDMMEYIHKHSGMQTITYLRQENRYGLVYGYGPEYEKSGCCGGTFISIKDMTL